MSPSRASQLILAKPYFTLEADASLRLHHVPVPKAPLASESEEQRYVDRYGRLVWLRQAVNRFGPARQGPPAATHALSAAAGL